MGFRNRVRNAISGRSERSTPAAASAPGGEAIDPLVDPLGAADQAESEGRLLDALNILLEANRRSPDPAVDERLLLARHRAYDEVAQGSGGRPEWPPAAPDLTPGIQGVPEIHRDDLTVDAVAMRKLAINPEVYVLDEAFKTIYAGDQINFENMKKQDLPVLAKALAENVNKRLGVPIVQDVLIDQLSYIPRSEMRGRRT